MNLSHIAILNIKSYEYNLISKTEQNLAIHVLKNTDLTEKCGTLQNRNNLFSCIKKGKEILMLGNWKIQILAP